MKIPVYPGQQVAPRTTQLVMPQGGGTGGLEAMSRGISALGQNIDQVNEANQREAHRARVAAVNDKDITYKNDILTALEGGKTDDTGPTPDVPKMTVQEFGKFLDGGDRQPGFMSLRGPAAGGARDRVLEQLAQRREELLGQLADPEARKLFDQTSKQDLFNARSRIEAHVTQQLRVAEIDSVKGLQAVTLRDIATSYTDDKLASDMEASVVGRLDALADSEEGKKAEIAAWQASITSTRLNQYLAAKDWTGAQNLYAREKSRLNATEQPHFANAINTLREKTEGDRTAFAVMDAARDGNGFVSPAKAIVAFQQLPEPQRNEQAQQAFAHALQLEEAKKRTAVDSVYNGALASYLQQHNLRDVNPYVEAWLRSVDSESWLKLEQIDKAHKQHARGQPATPQQLRAFSQFRLWAADNPDQAAQMTEQEFNRTWAPLMAKNDWDNAVGLLAGYHTMANKPEKIANAIDAAVQEVGGKGGAGVLPTDKRNKADWSPEDLDVYARASAYVQQKANEFRRSSGGKEPTVDDLRGWAKELFIAGKNPEGGFLGFGGNTTRIEAEVKGTGFVPKFGDDEKAKAVEALKEAGARVDDAAVDAYLRTKHKLPALPIQAKPQAPVTEVTPGQWGLDLSPPPATKTVTDIKTGGL